MRFLHPEAASWFLMLPVAVCAWYLHMYGKGRFRRRAPVGLHLPPISRLSTWRRDSTALACSVLAIGFLVAAMMRPQALIENRTPEYEKEDLLIVLDRSVSMRAQDVEPSRFTRAIGEIKDFLLRKPDMVDRVGLVGFASTSIVLSPMTRDVQNLVFYLDWIEQDLEPRFGTNIGNALANARELVKKDKRPTRKFFLLISDGDDQGPELAKEIAALRDEQTHVYTIGIGSERDAAIPIFNEDGSMNFLQTDSGERVTTRFNDRTLRMIATLTGARYIRSITGHELEPGIRAAVQHERKIVGWKSNIEYRDLYRACLAAAGIATLVLLLAL